MTVQCTRLFLLLTLAGLFLTAGCMVETNPEARAGSFAPVIPATPGDPVVIRFPCAPLTLNAAPHIIVNPIIPRTEGDVFEITGTTNLGKDTRIILEMHEFPHTRVIPSTPVMVNSDASGPGGYVRIQDSICPEKAWRYPANLTGFHNQTLVWVDVFPERIAYPSSVFNHTGFPVARRKTDGAAYHNQEFSPDYCLHSQESRDENTPPHIIINPIGPHTVGDVFEINGTTNLGTGSRIRIEVREETRMSTGPFDTTAVYYVHSGSKGNVAIRDSVCPEKFWSYPVNLTGFHGGKTYWVSVSPEHTTYPLAVFSHADFYVNRES